MYHLDEIRELHIELTERCNAKCPMCGRNQSGGKLNVNISQEELTYDFLQTALPEHFIRQLDRIRMCGNFGDPAAASETIQICEFFRMTKPAINLSLHSNGGLRSTEWWFKLGRLFRSENDEIYFALDGLEDTLSLYRRGVSYKKVIENATAAIRGGARAHWVMLVFDHNEHQIDDAKALAKKLGFASFRLKATKRFRSDRDEVISFEAPVKNTKDELLYTIRPPKNGDYVNPVLIQINSSVSGAIDCHVVNRKSLYISAKGEVFPCCWIGGTIYPADKSGPTGEVAELLTLCGGIEKISLRCNGLSEIIESSFFQQFPLLWKELKPQVCLKTCNPNRNGFKAQFIHREDFDLVSGRASAPRSNPSKLFPAHRND